MYVFYVHLTYYILFSPILAQMMDGIVATVTTLTATTTDRTTHLTVIMDGTGVVALVSRIAVAVVVTI